MKTLTNLWANMDSMSDTDVLEYIEILEMLEAHGDAPGLGYFDDMSDDMLI